MAIYRLLTAIIVLFIFGVFVSCTKKKQADLLFFNGIIYTVDSAFTIAEAIAVKDGRIEATGSSKDLLKEYEARESIDLKNKPVYPGFIDAHCHFFGYSCNLMKADLTATQSFDEVIDRVSRFSKTNSFSWVLGRGWDQNDWKEKDFPGKEKLDILFPGIPVFLQRIDGHAVLCNQKALDIANVTEKTKVTGGEIVLKNGKPTGVLIDNAVDLVSRFISPYPENIFIDALKKGEANCFEAGLTTVCDAGLGKDSIELIDKMQKERLLKIRVYAMIADGEKNREYYLGKGPYKTERLNVRSFKMYADGALGSRGACLLQPYSDEPGRYGFLLCDTTHMIKLADEAIAKGFQLNTHCIGDSAVRIVLKIYAKHLNGKNNKRWRIEHCQIVHPEDLHYFSDYSIIPSVQPTHATSDMYWAEERLGPGRIRYAYAYNELLNASDGHIAFGTDFPVEDIHPVKSFYAAVERKDLHHFPDGGFLPENKTSRQNTLRAMTCRAAWSCFEEDEKGSLEKGKLADFVIFDKDLMKIPAREIPGAKVLSTWVNGEKVFER